MFCDFIDFEKAFDKVWRDGLWYKLLLNNMNNNMYNIIVNMYSGTQSCISNNDCKSEYFTYSNVVRQLENSHIAMVYVNWKIYPLSFCRVHE